jgi:hypothetical protein
MKKNIGKTDRTLRILFAIVTAAIGYYYQSWWGLLAFIPLITSYIGFCPLYNIIGISTCKEKEC